MKLLLDVGNTRLKWRLLDGGRRVDAGALPTREAVDAGHWRTLPRPALVAGCCVADEAVRAGLEALSAALWSLPVRWLHAGEGGAAIVVSRYDLRSLGPDRWASVLAARHLAGGAVLAVNAGTAVTVDALSAEGVYLGGTILPGIALMRGALARNTARLPETDGCFAGFPATTADAIQTGVVDAACGAVERLRRRLGDEPAVLLSGGDADVLSPHFPFEVRPVDNLVLDGLQVMHP